MRVTAANVPSGNRKSRAVWILVTALAAISLIASVAERWRAAAVPHSSSFPARPLPPDAAQNEGTARFLAERLRQDPENFVALNMLAGLHLQRLRETGSLDSLDRAQRAARTSLAVVPAVRNSGGLAALAQAEFAAHEFVRARDHAIRLIALEPEKSGPWGLLGDARQELGDYDGVAQAYVTMARCGGGSVATQTRLARQALLRGEVSSARKHYADALAYALNLPIPPRETVAWCRWQLGETAFSVGDYAGAERAYNDALTTFPGYFRALASRGRVRAARGDFPGAIADYQQAVKIFPDPAFVAALGDLYQIAGRPKEARQQYALVNAIGHLSRASGALYNRQLALFDADHDRNPDDAYANAAREFAVRRDIYGADAVAWTALKAGKISVAQAHIKDALRLGTSDARLFYHAGLIARAAGDTSSARSFLRRALALCPQFDPLQARIARRALAALEQHP